MSWWPWVSAARFDDLLRERAKLEHELAEVKRSNKRQHDLVYRQQFGVQVYDTLPETQVASVAHEPEVELTPEQQAQQAEEYEISRLRSIAQTQPSRFPAEMARLRTRQQADAVRTAGAGAHPVQTIFSRVRQEELIKMDAADQVEVVAHTPTNGNGKH